MQDTSEWVGINKIDKEGLALHTSILASDEYEGRLPGTPAEEKTLDYLVKEFQKLGLNPGRSKALALGEQAASGDPKEWLQEMSLMLFTPVSFSDLVITSVASSSSQQHFRNLQDFTMFSRRNETKSALENTELIFAGYGIVAPEWGWNDYEGLDVKGKTVVVIVNDPGLVDDKIFNGPTMTYYGRWTYKFEEAARQGAAGLFIVHDNRGAGYNWSVVQQGKSGPHMHLPPTSYLCAIEGWWTTETAQSVFKLAGLDFDEEKRKAAMKGFKSYTLPLTCSVQLENKLSSFTSSNVVAALPGTDRKDEVIIYTAHWDHFGKRGDDIFHGARDNALSVAGVLKIAESLKNGPLRKRSFLFLIPTAEEQGLFGSHHYAQNPVFPLEKTVGVFNMDLVNIFGQTKDIAFYGHGKSELDDYFEKAAKIQGRVVTPDPQPENGLYYRSDHFPFAQAGVPGTFIAMGFDHVTKGREWMIARQNAWTDECYHKPRDEYVDDPASEWCWDLAGAVDDVSLLYMVGYKLANEDTFPQWRKTAEFSRPQ